MIRSFLFVLVLIGVAACARDSPTREEAIERSRAAVLAYCADKQLPTSNLVGPLDAALYTHVRPWRKASVARVYWELPFATPNDLRFQAEFETPQRVVLFVWDVAQNKTIATRIYRVEGKGRVTRLRH